MFLGYVFCVLGKKANSEKQIEDYSFFFFITGVCFHTGLVHSNQINGEGLKYSQTNGTFKKERKKAHSKRKR